MTPEWGWLAAGSSAVAVALAGRPGWRLPRSLLPPSSTGAEQGADERPDLLRRGRVTWSLCAAAGAWAVVPGPLAPLAAIVVGFVVWSVASRSESSSARREREAATRDVAALVDLFAGALSAGAPPSLAVQVVCEALPGPAADRLSRVRARLELGVDPARVWEDLAGDDVLGVLGRTLARAHASGASVAQQVTHLAGELAATARADVEDRARAVGVRAALPLGLCLLPAFLLLGVVPMVAGMLADLLG